MRVLVSGPDKERRKKGESSEIKEKVVDGSFLFPLRSASAPDKGRKRFPGGVTQSSPSGSS